VAALAAVAHDPSSPSSPAQQRGLQATLRVLKQQSALTVQSSEDSAGGLGPGPSSSSPAPAVPETDLMRLAMEEGDGDAGLSGGVVVLLR
jgi:hypothetical protein